MRTTVFLSTAVVITAFFAQLQEPNFTSDTVHSSICFGAGYAGGLTQVTGLFSDFKVKLLYDEKDITKSSVTAEIQVKSVNTGNVDRDRHLQDEIFFDASKHPTIRFVSKKVEKRSDQWWLIGDFTMRGVTKTIEFPFSIVGKRKDTQTQGQMIGFHAKTKIKRGEYGVSFGIGENAMSDEIDVEIHLLMKESEFPHVYLSD